MKPQTIDVKGKSRVDVTLQDDNTQLEELVVIGYGSVRKKDLTGSVATVNSEALQAVPVANASEALTGKMAGVQVTTTEGSPRRRGKDPRSWWWFYHPVKRPSLHRGRIPC